MSNTIHPSAIISESARLGENNHIGPWVSIEAGACLGDGNTLLQGAVLKAGCRLGNNNSVHEYAVIGGLPQDLGFDANKNTWVQVGDGNVIREYVTIHRATQEGSATRLGDNNYLMTQVHLGHDCRLGSHIVIAPGAGLGGHVHVEDKAFISGGVMVHQFVRIGSFAMIGGNAKVTQNILPYMISDGVPASAHGLNLVGLKRAGFSREELRALKQAYQLIHRSGERLETILDTLEQQQNPHASYLAEFIRGSKRGFHREK